MNRIIKKIIQMLSCLFVFTLIFVSIISPINANDVDEYDHEVQEDEYIVYPDDIKDTVRNMTMVTINGTRTKVTPDFVGPCTITYGESYTVNSSWTYSFSASVQGFIISKLQAQFGVAYSRSASSSENFQASFTIDSGYCGAVYFTPYLYKFNFIYVDGESHGYSATTTCPKKVGNFCDGLYQKIQRVY